MMNAQLSTDSGLHKIRLFLTFLLKYNTQLESKFMKVYVPAKNCMLLRDSLISWPEFKKATTHMKKTVDLGEDLVEIRLRGDQVPSYG